MGVEGNFLITGEVPCRDKKRPDQEWSGLSVEAGWSNDRGRLGDGPNGRSFDP